ncbi:hypothetical protein [Pseudomonas phage ANB1]|nr:hypothetical protein [Pseudomonas phage ANB1]
MTSYVGPGDGPWNAVQTRICAPLLFDVFSSFFAPILRYVPIDVLVRKKLHILFNRL